MKNPPVFERSQVAVPRQKLPRCAVLAVVLIGCVSRSTAADYSSVRSTVRARSRVQIPELAPASRKEAEPGLARLLSAPLTVESAIRVALLNNRDLRAELLSLGVERGQLVQASLFPNPEFEVQARVPQQRSEGIQWDLGLGIDLKQIILRGAREGVAEASLEAARIRVAGAVLDLGYRVRLAYASVQASEARLALAETTLAAAAASAESARALRAAGNVPELELASEEAAGEAAHVAVDEARADLRDERERMNILLGLFGKQVAWTVVGELPQPKDATPDGERTETQAIEVSLELREARAALRAQARRVGLVEESGWLPDLNLGVHAERDNRVWEVGPALQGSLPVFDRRQGQVQSLEAELDAMRERYVATAVAIRASVRAAITRLESAEQRAKRYRDQLLPARERVLRQTLLQYNAMQVGVFQLLQAKRDELDARRMYIETLREYEHARATVDQLLAGRLAGTIGSIPSTKVMANTSEAPFAGH